ncbi:MAG: (Fe-S)-binding protein [Rhodocyclaceae bacterium]|nr:MAG: (Fe-S)-binding protein [Rhodocyclaceae bacterium]
MEKRIYPAPPQQVYLFGTCLIDLFVPEAGMDALRLLEQAGVAVDFPMGQSCCGQPAYTSGNEASARTVAAAQMALFQEDWPIVVPSGSCAGMMRHHWPKLFAADPVLGPRAKVLAERTFELTEFLVEVLKVDFAALHAQSTVAPPPIKVALHTSCSARREMGTRSHGLALLRALPGVELVEQKNEAECCGFGGVFSLKHPDISGAMVADKTAAIEASGCDQLVSADAGCLCNIGHAAEHQGRALKVEHLASFVARRLRGEAQS